MYQTRVSSSSGYSRSTSSSSDGGVMGGLVATGLAAWAVVSSVVVAVQAVVVAVHALVGFAVGGWAAFGILLGACALVAAILPFLLALVFGGWVINLPSVGSGPVGGVLSPFGRFRVGITGRLGGAGGKWSFGLFFALLFFLFFSSCAIATGIEGEWWPTICNGVLALGFGILAIVKWSD